MFGKKKAYEKPDLERIPLAESEVTAVVGGVSTNSKKKTTVDTSIDNETTSVIDTSIQGQFVPGTGNGDVGRGRGRGGGCDGVPYHRNARTFSSGRNSGC